MVRWVPYETGSLKTPTPTPLQNKNWQPAQEPAKFLEQMKAIQFQPSSDILAKEVEIETPAPSGYDILVEVKAIALNPVDTKVRPKADGEAKILGFDAAGTIAAVGPEVTSLQSGDEVYYAGDITRPGSNAQFQLVDSRIVAKRPTTLDAANSAALPLTALTAWESLFDRLGIDSSGKQAGKSILIINGAGGVGSIAIQLAKLAGLTVLATASRPESVAWCRELGADHVLNHRESLVPQIQELGMEQVDYIANFHDTDAYWTTTSQLIAPQGKIVLIVEPTGPLKIGDPLKLKSVSIHWELMFTRSLFGTSDLSRQSEILTQVAALVDAGKLQGTQSETRSPINAANLMQAHRDIATQSTIGKITLAGW